MQTLKSKRKLQNSDISQLQLSTFFLLNLLLLYLNFPSSSCPSTDLLLSLLLCLFSSFCLLTFLSLLPQITNPTFLTLLSILQYLFQMGFVGLVGFAVYLQYFGEEQCGEEVKGFVVGVFRWTGMGLVGLKGMGVLAKGFKGISKAKDDVSQY